MPRWVLAWLKNYLQDRKTSLFFDGAYSAKIDIQAGVPQGSPLSPILALLYLAPLYKRLQERHPHVSIVGFADDTNLLAFGKTPEVTTRQLEEAWATCQAWALTRGIVFAPEKCELLHFDRSRKPWERGVQLGPNLTIQPKEEARFLGIWLDRKLTWKGHYKAIKRKMESQTLAISRLMGKTWGPNLVQARLLYAQVVRAALAYGAPAYHTPTKPGAASTAQVVEKKHLTTENSCLRAVLGAYKATPVRTLHTESAFPPLDLYLNKRSLVFEEKSRDGPLEGPLSRAIERLKTRFGRRKRRPQGTQGAQETPTRTEKAQATLKAWKGQARTAEEALYKAWNQRFRAQKKDLLADR